MGNDEQTNDDVVVQAVPSDLAHRLKRASDGIVTVDKSVGSVDKSGIRIPGAIWPDPANANFSTDRRDPFAMHDRGNPMKARRHTDLQDENE